jgi:hypothetical protein
LFLRPEREKVHTVVGQCSGLRQKSAANSQGRTNQEAGMQTQLKDSGRKWLWGFLAVIGMSQLYVVRELLAALALFALGFTTIAFVVASLYMLQNCCELAVARLANIRRPVMNVASVSRENQKAA